LNLTLTNADKRFSPEYASSPLAGYLAPLRPVRIEAWDGSTRRTHWSGWLESLAPTPQQYGPRTVEFQCAGPMLFFQDAETTLAVQENQRTDQLIEALLNEVALPLPLTQQTLLDTPGHNELGLTTLLGDPTIARSLEVGKTTLAYAADNWLRRGENTSERPDTFNVYRAIKDVVAAERGRFFFDRAGQAVFWNRHHFVLNQIVTATFNDTMTDLSYQFAARGDFANQVAVTCHPRTISATSDEILWQLEQPVTIRPQEEREIGVAYRDDSQNRIGGRNVRLGEYTFSAGTGSVWLSEVGANRAKLRVRNDSTANLVLQTCVVRGQKITDFGALTAEVQDHASRAQYGVRRLDWQLQALDNYDAAQQIAAFELHRRRNPAGHLLTLSLSSAGQAGGGQHAQQLVRTIGDRITVSETQTAHSGDYFIIGERQRLSGAGSLLETTWYLEPAVQGNWMILDQSLLDGSAALLY
jgi:hypothetical protein